MEAVKPADLWGKEVYSQGGERLGKVEAIGMGRDRVPRRVGVRPDEHAPQLTFFALAGAKLADGRVILDAAGSPQIVPGSSTSTR
ncbi:MAG: hypothetical protein J2P45_08105 [Candidatus Dormibacteraeota bacterium]|nr:hypothetical protein [Candidatus Dormibacteraeota bacterium]